MKKLEPINMFKRIEEQRNYKTSNALYDNARRNEKFIIGEQWDETDPKNLKRNTYNFIGKTVEIKNASILSNELAIQRSSDAVDDDNQQVQDAIKFFNMADTKNWERLRMDSMNEQLVMNAAIEGLGVSYWYWDDDIRTGNTSKNIGDINGQLVDSINVYFGNPYQVDAQKQPWISLTVDMTLSELRQYAENKGVGKEDAQNIQSDEAEQAYRAYEKADYEQTNKKSEQATLMIHFEKDSDGKIWKCETTKDVVIEDWKDIDMTLYPIAIFPYKTRKRFIYGEAEPTRYIENQKMANVQMAARHMNALLMAVPKVLVNENVTGSFSNAIGSINKVKLPPNASLSSAMQFVQPTAMTIDVDKSIDDLTNRTMDYAGVNQNIQGAARPENAAALLTQIKQASIPIESYKRRLYKYIEDVALIWLEFYKTKYNLERKYKDEDGEYTFTGTDFADIVIDTRTDVGPSTQWSEITAFQMLMDMWNAGVIKDPQAVLERLPQNSLMDQDGLLSQMKLREINQIMIEAIVGPEQAEVIAQMTPDEQLQMIGGMQSGMQGM